MVFYCVSKKRLFLLGLILFLMMFISGIYSLADEINDTQSGLSTSAVDIEIKEYNQNNELFQENGKTVMPGDEIILIPRVNNLGIDCYIRAKITYTIRDEVFSEVDYIIGDYSSWTKSGEYYYYDSIFGKEESVDLFQKVIIPNLSSDYYGSTVIVNMVVDAIQAKNFDGNWEGIEIKESINRTYDINYTGESAVIYEDDANRHILLDSGFFDQLGNMLPGDFVSESFTLLNSSNSRNGYYFSIDYDDLTSDELALLRQMRLVLKKQNGDVLIDSNLANKDRHSLGIYSKGKGDTFVIEVSLPNDIDNDYSRLFTKIMWRFSYDVLEQPVGPNPYTGDLKFDLSITVFILSTIGFLVVLVLGKINSENIEKNNIEKRKFI